MSDQSGVPNPWVPVPMTQDLLDRLHDTPQRLPVDPAQDTRYQRDTRNLFAFVGYVAMIAKEGQDYGAPNGPLVDLFDPAMLAVIELP
jgi:hypothetical protein